MEISDKAKAKKVGIDTYCNRKIDLDGSHYWDTKGEVDLFYQKYADKSEPGKKLKAIFSDFEARSEQWLYIKGNYLYFTLDGAKYWYKLTSSTWEDEHINEVINSIEPFIEAWYYDRGTLD